MELDQHQNNGASPSSGSFKENDVIDLKLILKETINVDTTNGTPTIKLNVGNNYTVDYDSLENSQQWGPNSTMVFKYTVQAGHNVDELSYVDINSFKLNGAIITDVAGDTIATSSGSTPPNEPILYGPDATSTLKWNTDIAIDTTKPTILSVECSSDGPYSTGDDVDIYVKFDDILNVTGTPKINIDLFNEITGSPVAIVKEFTYVSKSTSGSEDTLKFQYNVEDYINTTLNKGIVIKDISSVIDLNGGAITDVAGNEAELNVASNVITNAAIIDTRAVKVVGLSVSGLTLNSDNKYYVKAGVAFDVNVELSKNVSYNGANANTTNAPYIEFGGLNLSNMGSKGPNIRAYFKKLGTKK